MLVTSILFFSECFLPYQRQKSSFQLNLSSANVFSLVTSNILSFGKQLTLKQQDFKKLIIICRLMHLKKVSTRVILLSVNFLHNILSKPWTVFPPVISIKTVVTFLLGDSYTNHRLSLYDFYFFQRLLGLQTLSNLRSPSPIPLKPFPN